MNVARRRSLAAVIAGSSSLASIRGALPLVVLASSMLGCTTALPSAASSGPPVLGIDWGRAASVERPSNYVETVSPSYLGVHPILRIAGQAAMTDVEARTGGGFVAIGYAPPDFVPVAWTSADGQTWTFHQIDTVAFSFPISLSTGPDGTVVAVGRSGKAPIAWTTTDGVTWSRHAVTILAGSGVAERMTSVAAGSQGLVAGGSVGPELSDRHARFWRSADGITWQPVADDPVAFGNAEVRAITAFNGGFVAVGVVGNVQDYTGAVAWTSPDGATWTRVDDPTFVGGVAVSVVPAPFGGLVAVGSLVDRQSALAWTSPDGRTWTRTPRAPSLQHSGGFVGMTDVASIGDTVIAVGVVQGLQYGTAVSWVSRDGLSWVKSAEAPVQEGAEFYAIAPFGAGALALGAFNLPDSYAPDVWITPAR